MIPRRVYQTVQEALARQAAVALIGPRQVGKTTLAHELAAGREALYLDLEARRRPRSNSSEPALFLKQLRIAWLVILDEIHRVAGTVPRTLRGLIDQGRRARASVQEDFSGSGSASMDLAAAIRRKPGGPDRQYVDMGPLDILRDYRPMKRRCNRLWVRGGFPDSYLANRRLPIASGWRKELHPNLSGARTVPQLGRAFQRRHWSGSGPCWPMVRARLLNASRLASGLIGQRSTR